MGDIFTWERTFKNLKYIAREMTSEFIRPVFTGNAIT